MREIFQNNIENAIKNTIVDFLGNGIVSGLKVMEDNSPSKSVIIKSGVAYFSGSRMAIESDFYYDLNYSIPATQKRITSLCLKPKRVEFDQRQDGYGNNVFFRSVESYELIIIDGAIESSPLPPTLQSDSLLIGDITLSAGQTQILNSDISFARVKYLNENNKKLIDAFFSMLEKSQNLNDLSNKATARSNLDVYNKSEVDTKDTNTLNSSKSYTDGQIANHDSQHDDRFYLKSEVDTKDTNTLNSSKSYTDGQIANHDSQHDDRFVKLSGLGADLNANYKTIYNLYLGSYDTSENHFAASKQFVKNYVGYKFSTLTACGTYTDNNTSRAIYTYESCFFIVYLLNTNGSSFRVSLVRDSDGWAQVILPIVTTIDDGIQVYCPQGWHIVVESFGYKQYVVMALI